jgi:pimeloyl-ACP methyl ester carboxylesterase
MEDDVLIDRQEVECAGTKTHVRVAGRGDPPLVLLHGVLSDGGTWEQVMPALARHRCVIAPDFPLHGRTDTPEGFDIGPEGLVGWLEALVDSQGTGAVDLCGLSMGGAVAAHFARLRPERVRDLVLVDAANIVPLAEPMRGLVEEVMAKVEAALGVGGPDAVQCWTAELDGAGDKTPTMDLCTDPIIAGVLEYIEGKGISMTQALSGLELLEPLAPGDLGAIDARVLAIWGELDPYFPAREAEAALASGLSKGRVEVLPGAGHNPVEDSPERFLELLEGFLGR